MRWLEVLVQTDTKKINLTKPSIGKEEIEAAAAVLESRWVIRGTQTQALEQEFAEFVGAEHAVATNGCTMALYLAIKQMNLTSEDEVIVPSLTWTATASVVIQAGATPVFADVKREDWCLDPEDVGERMTDRTRLIVPVHYCSRFAGGFEDFDVPVLFDSAHRIERDDFLGIPSCYSFYAVKNMTTIRGGMVVTDDEEAARCYRMACHGGLAKDTLSRYQGVDAFDDPSSFYYEVEVPGWNFDMTDVEAAIGREQLRKVEFLNAKRSEIAARYNEAFGLNNGGNHMYVLLVENRDEFLINMKKSGIQCGIHYLPLHLMRGYRYLDPDFLPVTEYIGERCVTIPLHPELSEEEVGYIIDCTTKYARIVV
jgi:dTDP-4-amino-4,6-dideoxygalactose transaminase